MRIAIPVLACLTLLGSVFAVAAPATGGDAPRTATTAPPAARASRADAPPAARITDPLAHTFSIVARDPETGDLGVAVQSHYFSVGPIVPWAEPGVGAVATQSLVEVSYGPKGLEMMSNGKGAKQTLADLLAQDESRDVRQVAMVDSRGEVAVHTGSRCIAFAGDHVGNQYSCQANLMASEKVWP
ncbi:MAG: DUF1028 domain-containing protein, partial [Candidatus Latescibacteria bacterium]|nr:DUF1028 domain-containing protein [Candidatus Latescibacterota bacterium]